PPAGACPPSSAPLSQWSPSRLRSRRRAASSARRAGSAARRRRRAPGCRSCGGPRRVADRREGDRERRAAALLRLDPEPAAVELDEAARDREPEPRAAAVERLEDQRLLAGRDAGAVVRDAQDDLRTGVPGAPVD